MMIINTDIRFQDDIPLTGIFFEKIETISRQRVSIKKISESLPNVGKWQNSIESRFPNVGKWQNGFKIHFPTLGNGKTVSKSISQRWEMAKQ
ncbi:MAG: hypothetical protein LBR10_05420, partial [Prevotellaceae bacterium]|nr:hypothetical protein [Prevotellaceae bacterium]